jgi:hypothetical protein
MEEVRQFSNFPPTSVLIANGILICREAQKPSQARKKSFQVIDSLRTIKRAEQYVSKANAYRSTTGKLTI